MTKGFMEIMQTKHGKISLKLDTEPKNEREIALICAILSHETIHEVLHHLIGIEATVKLDNIRKVFEPWLKEN